MLAEYTNHVLSLFSRFKHPHFSSFPSYGLISKLWFFLNSLETPDNTFVLPKLDDIPAPRDLNLSYHQQKKDKCTEKFWYFYSPLHINTIEKSINTSTNRILSDSVIHCLTIIHTIRNKVLNFICFILSILIKDSDYIIIMIVHIF